MLASDGSVLDIGAENSHVIRASSKTVLNTSLEHPQRSLTLVDGA